MSEIEYNTFNGDLQEGYYHLGDLDVSPTTPDGESADTHHWRVERDDTGRGWVIWCVRIDEVTQ